MKPWLMSVAMLCAVAGASAAQTIPFKDSFDPGTPATMKVKLRIGAQMTAPSWFTMDTGSVGIVMPAADLPADAVKGPQATIKYTSSGVEWLGVWTSQPVTFTDANDKPLATATVEVFAAQTPKCTGKGPNAKSCDVAKLQRQPPHMMGIGFGRPDPYALPTRNPAIHVAKVAEQSYRIDQTGLTFGVPLQSLPASCVRQALKPSTTPGFVGDWQTPTGTLTINNVAAPANILLDTGIADALIGAAKQPSSGELAMGSKITIGFLDNKLRLAYAVTSAPVPGVPVSFHWIHYHGTAFINTGIAPLSRYVYYFNSSKGVVALCPL